MTPSLRVVAWFVGAFVAACGLGAQVPGEMRGRVTNARSAAPVVDARVDVSGRPESIRSGADGAFIVRGLEPRRYLVRIRAVGFIPRDVETEIVNGRSTTLDIALDPSPATLRPIIVSAARDSAAANVIAFDRATIESSGRRDLGELLRSAAGVVVTQTGGPGSASHASIRGSGASEVLVLVDGVPINSVITGDADLSHVSLETIERVTVRTGAQSARYGGRALAGVIEIQTRRSASETSALIRGGAWGEREASASLGDGRMMGSARLAGSLTGDYRTIRGDFPYELPALRGGGIARRVNSDVTSRQAVGGLSVDGDSSAIRLRGSLDDLTRGLAGSIIQPSITGRQTHSRLSGGADARRDRQWLSWIASADVTRERSTFVDSAPPFGTPYDDAVTATGTTTSASVTSTFPTGSIAVGGEVRTLDVASTMLAVGAPHWQRLLGTWGSVRASHAFAATQLHLDGDASVRVDQSSLMEGTVLSPRVAATLSRGVVVASGSVGSGYSPPSLADQFFHEGVLVRANSALRPERTTADAEARFGIHDAVVGPLMLSGDAAAFRANIDGMILWLPDFRFIWSPSNFTVHRSGWELSGRAAVPRFGADVQGTLNTADVVYTGAVLSGQVAYRPRTTASVTVGITPRSSRLEISNRHVGDRRTVPGSALNALAPYWLTDTRWTYASTRGRWLFDTSIGIENLFDHAAAMLVDYPFPGRTWTLALRVRRSPLS